MPQTEETNKNALRIRNFSNVMAHLLMIMNYSFIVSMGHSDDSWEEKIITVEKYSCYTFKIITFPCAGASGLNNQIYVKEVITDEQ